MMKKHPRFQMALLPAALLLAVQANADEQATQLQDITVKAQRISARPLQDFREFEKSNVTDLKDVLADEPSIQFGGGNGLSQHITLRGMGADQIDYVVDNTCCSYILYHYQYLRCYRFQEDQNK